MNKSKPLNYYNHLTTETDIDTQPHSYWSCSGFV